MYHSQAVDISFGSHFSCEEILDHTPHTSLLQEHSLIGHLTTRYQISLRLWTIKMEDL